MELNPEKQMRLIRYNIDQYVANTHQIPYGIEQIQAPDIWKEGEKGEGVVIAVLDSGADKDHPDLKDAIIDGRNFTREGTVFDFTDKNSHGTHVAGTIAARENSKGVIGVAPEAKLLICKVLTSDGYGAYNYITKAINWCTKWRGPNGERVRVISMSLGGPYHDKEQYKAILNACAAGILVVAASGNEGDGIEDTYELAYPSAYNEVITVAASDRNKKLAPFSNTHLQVDCISPGVGILSTIPGGKYAVFSGTSMATPHISGALALIIKIGEKQFKRTLTESEIFALLAKTCCSLGYQKSSEGNGMPELKRLFTEC
jgi:major intracellular serine protease